MTNQTEQHLNPVIWLVPLVNTEPYSYIIYGWTDFGIQELSFDTELQLALISPPPNSQQITTSGVSGLSLWILHCLSKGHGNHVQVHSCSLAWHGVCIFARKGLIKINLFDSLQVTEQRPPLIFWTECSKHAAVNTIWHKLLVLSDAIQHLRTSAWAFTPQQSRSTVRQQDQCPEFFS